MKNSIRIQNRSWTPHLVLILCIVIAAFPVQKLCAGGGFVAAWTPNATLVTSNQPSTVMQSKGNVCDFASCPYCKDKVASNIIKENYPSACTHHRNGDHACNGYPELQSVRENNWNGNSLLNPTDIAPLTNIAIPTQAWGNLDHNPFLGSDGPNTNNVVQHDQLFVLWPLNQIDNVLVGNLYQNLPFVTNNVEDPKSDIEIWLDFNPVAINNTHSVSSLDDESKFIAIDNELETNILQDVKQVGSRDESEEPIFPTQEAASSDQTSEKQEDRPNGLILLTTWPNPTFGKLMVKLSCESAEPITFRLVSTEGKLLGTATSRNSQAEFDLSHYSVGTYHLQAMQCGNVWHSTIQLVH